MCNHHLSVIGIMSHGQHLTREGRVVYIVGRYTMNPDRSINKYPWLVHAGGRNFWSVDDSGRHYAKAGSPFDIVSKVPYNLPYVPLGVLLPIKTEYYDDEMKPF